MRYRTSLNVLLLLCLFSLFVSVAIAQDDEDTDADDVLIGEAQVSNISFDADTNTLTFTAELADSCTDVGEIRQEIEDDTLFITVETTRPADAMCAAVLGIEDVEYEIDTSEIPTGEYTLVLNEETLDDTLVVSGDDEDSESNAEAEAALTCPTPDDETLLYEGDDLCFLYPQAYDVLEARNVVLVSQPLTDAPLILIIAQDADDITLEDIMDAAEGDSDTLTTGDLVLGGQEAVVIETDDARTAHIILDEIYYTISVEPLASNTAEELWALVIDGVFFPEDTDTDS